MQTRVFRGGQAGQDEIDTSFLGDVVKVRLLRHAVRMYETNTRAGTQSTKSRGDLHYRKAPMFRQKGTGRARVRHPQATQCRHGGVPHGPKPRDYSYHIPKRARLEALRSALLSKFRDDEITLVDDFGLSRPRTKDLAAMLQAMGRTEGTCLLVTRDRDENLLLSARNLPRVEVRVADDVNAYELLRFKNVVMTDDALETIKRRTTKGDE